MHIIYLKICHTHSDGILDQVDATSNVTTDHAFILHEAVRVESGGGGSGSSHKGSKDQKLHFDFC